MYYGLESSENEFLISVFKAFDSEPRFCSIMQTNRLYKSVIHQTIQQGTPWKLYKVLRLITHT